MIECQVNYIIKLLEMARKSTTWKYIQVTQEAVESYYDTHIRKALRGKVNVLYYMLYTCDVDFVY